MFGDQKSNVNNSNNTIPSNNNKDYKGKIDNNSGRKDPKQDK